MNIDAIIGVSVDSIIRSIVERVKARRLEKDLTQKAFAMRAGVNYGAYRKFEQTGYITLANLVRCAMILDDLDGFNNLFVMKQYTSLDALIEGKQAKTKKRGTRNE
jgi:transcriptional regulator with XRE-family HTH domain